TVTLDGADADDASAPDWAALAAPDTPDALDRWLADEGARIVSSARTRAALDSPPPPVAALAGRVRAAGPRGAEPLVAGDAPPPRSPMASCHSPAAPCCSACGTSAESSSAGWQSAYWSPRTTRTAAPSWSRP